MERGSVGDTPIITPSIRMGIKVYQGKRPKFIRMGFKEGISDIVVTAVGLRLVREFTTRDGLSEEAPRR